MNTIINNGRETEKAAINGDFSIDGRDLSESERARLYAVREKLAAPLRDRCSQEKIAVYRRICDFVTHLEREYESPKEYALFHILMGSGPKNIAHTLKEFDFPAPDSVESFAEQFYQEHKTKSEALVRTN